MFHRLSRVFGSSLLALLSLAASSAGQTMQGPRETQLFDSQWKFQLGDVEGAQNAAFSDAGWRSLDLPHDYSIEGPAGADPSTMVGPFDRRSPAGGGGGFLNGGVAWYRKTFTVPAADAGKRVTIQFDGVYMDSTIYLNGKEIGKHPYGYTSFSFDLTPDLKFGEANTIAVRTNVQQPCSRWYSGAGIYRHVWLTVTDPVHLAQWGTFITTPEVTDASATVRVQTALQNDGKATASVTLTTILRDSSGREITRLEGTQNLDAGKGGQLDQKFTVPNPQRWSTDTPTLYTAVSEVRVGGKLVDATTTRFGIRTFEFTADKGFTLNGKHVPIQGVCNHHDLGALGSAAYRRGIQRQLEILREMGCNAIRTSHNPPSPELLDLCDEMGFVVMDESFDEWKRNKTRFGYGRFFDDWSELDIVSMVRRDRNHPSVILWSIGNEISEQGAPNGGQMARRLADFVLREDPTRPVTAACNNPEPAVRTGFAEALNVFGINYNVAQYQRQKGKVLIGSETSSTVSTRGEYLFNVNAEGKLEIVKQDNQRAQLSAYDLVFPRWATLVQTEFRALKNAPWVAGEFVWTGFDYIGEPTPFPWPARSSYFGIVDLAGFPKDRFYLYQSQWSSKPMVHIFPHWNWEQYAGKEIPVWAYTNCDSVELFLNGKSLGEKTAAEMEDYHLTWHVAYAPGALKAVAKKGGQVVATKEIRTAGQPAKLVLKADRSTLDATGQDLSFVTVSVTDNEGNLCPNADHKITFSLAGPGLIAGLDNGDPTNLEPFKGTEHTVFHGLGLAIIRGGQQTGEITLTAKAEGLAPATVQINIKK